MARFQWHAGEAYNQESGEHLYTTYNDHRYEIHKTVVRPGREWAWDIIVRPACGGEISEMEVYHTLKDAKRSLEQNDWLEEIKNYCQKHNATAQAGAK